MARTALIAGTATAVSGRVARRQQGRWAEQAEQANQQPTAPPEPAPAATAAVASSASADMADKLSQLERLGQLKAQGILTDEEFEAQKQKILAS
jgi:hypothetical protein